MPPAAGTTRRRFLAQVAAATTAVATKAVAARAGDGHPAPLSGPICLFTKPLIAMEWARLAQAARQLGFDGLDLTVRPGGHVLPERAAGDLPRAVDAARAAGIAVPMITTGLTSADDPHAREILSTAGRLGIRYFKTGYYLYDGPDVKAALARAAGALRGLVALAAEHGVQAGYHNHEDYVGGAIWDLATIVEPLDPRWAGYYFDARHAVAEGGAGAWAHALDLVTPRLKMIAVKDFRWTKTAEGWRDPNCPLGEGMVDWPRVLRTMAAAGFSGPVSLHLEYEPEAPPPASREEALLVALGRDLAFLKARMAEARG
jgi:sugar phosphate isomerase/epimerase